MTEEADMPVPANWHKFNSCGICACGVKWTTIRNVGVDEWWPKKKDGDGKPNDGFAHIGDRTPQEAAYVVWCRKKEDEAIAGATGWLPVVREQLPTDQVTFYEESGVISGGRLVPERVTFMQCPYYGELDLGDAA